MFDNGVQIAKANLLDVNFVPLEFQNNVTVGKNQIKYVVTVMGYNSAKFDINLLLSSLNHPFKIKSILGSGTHMKCLQLTKKGSNIILRFIDAMSLAGPAPLADFVRSFSTNPSKLKGFFPYEAFDITNYDEVLSKSEPFPKDDFYSTLKETTITDSDYNTYLEEAKCHSTRWDYLRFYNILDVECMISPLDNIIDMNWQYKVDTLLNLSLSANASSIKYALAYKDFDINGNYEQDTTAKTFYPNREWFKRKCENYLNQDKKAKRDIKDCLSEKDFDYIMRLYDQSKAKCYICNQRFTWDNKPTLDRIDNNKAHTKDNVKFCCEFCNCYKSNKDEQSTRLTIQLRNYALKYNLPMTLSKKDEYAYQVLRRGITGGLSYVQHRKNLKGVTKINHFQIDTEDHKVYSVDTENTMTHVIGVDFNSLYPSAFSSNFSSNNPYTGGKMYMAGRILDTIMTDTNEKKNLAKKIIFGKQELFVAEVKGHVDEKYLNEFINFPPIFRNLEINTNKHEIGEYMYNYMQKNNLKTDKNETKLTMLLSTHDTFMSFSSYYLWFLIDRCHFIIDDIKSIITFTKHDKFNSFVNEFMSNRIRAMEEKNK
jgi:hypothetical protein